MYTTSLKASPTPPAPPALTSSSASLPPISSARATPARSTSPTAHVKTPLSHVSHSPLVSSAVQAAHRYAPPQTSANITTTNTTHSDGDVANSRLSSLDGARRGSPCYSDLSLDERNDEEAGREHHDRAQESHDAAARDGPYFSGSGMVDGKGQAGGGGPMVVTELPSTLVASAPEPERGSWHGLEGGGLSLGNSTTQPNTSLSVPSRARGPLRGMSNPATPALIGLSSPTTPPASSSLFSLRDHTTAHNSLTTPPQQGAMTTMLAAPHTRSADASIGAAGHSRGGAATAVGAAQSARAKMAVPRKQHRLDSAQARRVVVAKQRHRKLFELNNTSSENGTRATSPQQQQQQWRSDGRSSLYGGGTAGQADQERRGLDLASDASAGWMAALSSPTSTRVPRDHHDSEMHSTTSGPSRSVASSTHYMSSSAGGVHPSSSSGAARCSSTNVTAAPPAAPSNSRGSVHPLHLSTNSSFKTVASLTSLQHRLWQHTATAAGVVTPTNPAPSAQTERGVVHGNLGLPGRRYPHSLPPSPPPARPPPLPGLPQRSVAAAASMRQQRHGQYAALPTGVAPSPASSAEHSIVTVDGNTKNGGGVGGALVSYPRTSSSPATVAVPVPVTRWEDSLMAERRRGQQGLRIAQWLIQQLLSTPPATAFDRSRYASFRAVNGGGPAGNAFDLTLDERGGPVNSGKVEEEEEEEMLGGGGLLRSLSERAAVAAFLLSSLVEDGLPRHQQSIVPYVRMLIEFAFVPDTPAIRTALGNGTVQDEELLDRLALYDHCTIPLTPPTASARTKAGTSRAMADAMNGTAAMATTLPMSSVAADGEHRPPHEVLAQDDDEEAEEEEVITVDLMELLAPAFTRKTYITAHFELSGLTVGLAHEVRCRELHQRNVPRLLERTHKNWMRGLMRAVLRAWRRLCQERRVQEQRQRARWALRWTSERMRISLRRWRGYAALTLQIAEADSVAKAALAQRKALIDRLESEAAAMQKSSEQLQSALQQQEEQREVVEATITEREILYQRLLRQVREVDRVGSLMLHSLLLAKAPPRFNDASMITALTTTSGAAAAAGRRLSLSSATFAVTPRGSIAGSADGLSSLDDDDDDNGGDADGEGGDGGVGGRERALEPSHAVTAIPTLLQWAKDGCAAAEEEYFALYPTDVDLTDAATSAALEPQQQQQGEETSGAGTDGEGKKAGNVGSKKAATTPSKQRKRSAAAGDATADPAEVPPPPTHAALDFDALLLSSNGLLNPSDAAIGETVLLPLHKLLLLMRGCSGLGNSGEAATEETLANAALAPPDAQADLLAAADAAAEKNGADRDAGGGGGVATAAAPTFEMIRTVQVADAAVLKEAYELLDRDSGAQGTADYAAESAASSRGGNQGSRDGSGADGQSSGLPLLLRLSAEKRDTLQRVCRVVIDAYEQLTGTACVVTAEQLLERTRGIVLVFLAALMRHYTNWLVRRTQQALPTTAAPSTTTAEGTAVAAHGGRQTNSEGVAHQRYDEWSHPPHSHRRWRGQVRRQAEWIALSFSAVHDALRIATMPSRVLTVGQQDHVSSLLEKLSLTEFIDLLPNSPDQTMQCYVSMVGVVERCAPSLHLLFHQFALPLAQLRADGGAGAATTAKPKQRRSTRGSLAPNGSSSSNHGGGSGSPETDVYVTANTVWLMLCMTGLAGEGKEEYCTSASRARGTTTENTGTLVNNTESNVSLPVKGAAGAPVRPPFSATLHRQAVYSLVEQVTQHGVASTATALRQSSMRQPSNAAAASPRKIGGGGPDVGRASPENYDAGSLTSPLVQTVSCKTRPRTCYARALREGRHVDLRPDAGAVCVNYTQFVKVLIRLAHAWQCQQQQREEAEQEALAALRRQEHYQRRRNASEAGDATEAPATPTGDGHTSKKHNGGGDDGDGAAAHPRSRRSSSATPATAVYVRGTGSRRSSLTAPRSRQGSLNATPRNSRPGSSSSAGGGPRPTSASATSTVARIEYEAGNYAHTLSLPYFYTFLEELLLPRLLGANRWMNAAQRAMSSRPVLQLLAQHHDALLEVFNDYQRPREARGVRAALPPPYSTVLASQLFSRVVDAERQASSGLTVGGGRSMSHVQRASLMYGLNSSMNRRGSSTALFEVEDLNDDKHGRGGGKGGGAGRKPSQQSRSSYARSTRSSFASQEDAALNDNLRASIAAAQLRDVSIVSVLQWEDVLLLAKDMRWFSIRRLTETALRRCFEQARADAAREGDALFFGEFLQLLCALSFYAVTNPAVPLEAKLNTFLESYLFSTQD